MPRFETKHEALEYADEHARRAESVRSGDLIHPVVISSALAIYGAITALSLPEEKPIPKGPVEVPLADATTTDRVILDGDRSVDGMPVRDDLTPAEAAELEGVPLTGPNVSLDDIATR